MAEVTLTHLDKVYPGGVQAVNDANLRIRDGEFVVLVGPSGCGKSTTLRMIAGLEEISGGTVQIGERVVNDVLPKDRDIAMVFQDYALYPHMTVYQNMAFALKLRHTPREEIDQRVEEAASVLGITPLLARKPKALSGGQRQRVALGRAIVRQPKVFLFDEPLSNLDAKLRVEMRAELKRLHRRLHATTVYVTHDQEEAMTLGDRIVVMKDGRIQQCGTPLEVYGRPVNRFVAGFVGTPPMNFLSGALRRVGEEVRFDAGTEQITLLPAHAAQLARWSGQQVILGIRPEALGLESKGRFAGAGNRLTVRVTVLEPLGEKMDLYASTAAYPKIVARVDAQTNISEEQELTLHLDLQRLHLFAAQEDGENLLLAGEERGERDGVLAGV